LPFGRTWDKKTKRWGLDPDKRAQIEEVAARYLAGESLVELAEEHGHSYCNLYKILRERCGPVGQQRFRDPRFRIEVAGDVTVPPLLPDETIRRVRERLEDNRTNRHGSPLYDYLLNGFMFCGGCGYNLTGELNKGHLTYRHPHTKRDRPCPYGQPRPWAR